MAFQAGQKVVYPKHGVSVVQGSCEKTVDGKKCSFYQIKLPVGDAMVFVPKSNAEDNGIRALVDKGKSRKFFQVLRSETVEVEADWKARFERNSTRMSSGCIFEAAQILKVLAIVRLTKPLSFKEREMFDQVKALAVAELAAVLKEAPAEVTKRIDTALQDYVKRHGPKAGGHA
jgi:CarD family transcriptional regulator